MPAAVFTKAVLPPPRPALLIGGAARATGGGRRLSAKKQPDEYRRALSKSLVAASDPVRPTDGDNAGKRG